MASVKTCFNCKNYHNSGFDYCCMTCRDNNGSVHGKGCCKVSASLPKICFNCKNYHNSGYDYCCNTCRYNNGSAHGLGCMRISQSSHSTTNKCLGCNTHPKHTTFSHCCKTCHSSGGTFHGNGCTGANKTLSQSSHSSSLPLEPLSNLRTGAPLYGTKVICFYNSHCKYYEFTNFYEGAPIVIDGKTWRTTEHYFQAKKFLPSFPAIADEIAQALKPKDAFVIARKYPTCVRSDWHNGYKDQVMLVALRAKFKQHIGLRNLLVSTGDNTLVEHTINDDYWGDNGDGTGKNQLGKLLMQVRDAINTNTI
ncbi:hypothetical protein QJ857_gp0757 [Tupanvirus soda lake]|uniref:NADAR domain-containing protein n=2 Tax=Tupanvirus TaxID=2094720 RepID=A0A6N1P2P1_9VIRU|nr:hypothetical protein QJ857_gp0757 [Tupanvirus soda lake]QKU35291.1 hypothetical protein [Tupanvirus soda lake]